MKEEILDFRPLGLALKRAREKQGLTREQLSEKLEIAPRHIQAIENEGQMPSLRLLVRMARMLGVSLDAFVFGDSGEVDSSRRRVELKLGSLKEDELRILEAVMDAMLRNK